MGATICAICCGTGRGVTIRCPADCVYLTAAEQHPPAVVQRRRDGHVQFLASAAAGLGEGQAELFLLVQSLIAAAAARLAVERLTDSDVAAAAGALAATHETAARGLIYEHHATTPGAERLAAELKTALVALEREGWRLRHEDVGAVLRRVERAATDAGGAFGDARAYLALVAELFPPRRAARGGVAVAAEEGPRLILP